MGQDLSKYAVCVDNAELSNHNHDPPAIRHVRSSCSVLAFGKSYTVTTAPNGIFATPATSSSNDAFVLTSSISVPAPTLNEAGEPEARDAFAHEDAQEIEPVDTTLTSVVDNRDTAAQPTTTTTVTVTAPCAEGTYSGYLGDQPWNTDSFEPVHTTYLRPQSEQPVSTLMLADESGFYSGPLSEQPWNTWSFGAPMTVPTTLASSTAVLHDLP